MPVGFTLFLCHAVVISSAAAQTPASRAASQPVAFQPGVLIDWRAPAVLVDARVVLREGPLEFFACFAGKEHESILRVEAEAEHVYMATGLIGVSPGHPPRWSDSANRFEQPAGDLVDVFVSWDDSGVSREAGAFDWLEEIEYARAPLPRAWVFAGSVRHDDGVQACARSGAGFALVDFSDSLFSLTRSRVSRDSDLWAAANTSRIPPRGTPVQIVIRPARLQVLNVAVGLRGEWTINGRFATIEDVADLTLLAQRCAPSWRAQISCDLLLTMDRERLARKLAFLGVAENLWSWAPAATSQSASKSAADHPFR